MAHPTEGAPVGAVQFSLRRARRLASTGRRLARWAASPAAFPVPPRGAHEGRLVLEVRFPLASDADPVLEAGKRHNVRLAAARFDGRRVGPEAPLSFCRVLGPVTAGRGFRPGRELRGGCVVPSVGGGVCVLANALFEAGVRLGWAIVERHGHSVEAIPPLPGRLWGLDATTRWPDVDLRLRPLTVCTLGVCVADDALVVRVWSATGVAQAGDDPLVGPRDVQVEARGVRVEPTPHGRFRVGELWRRVGAGPWTCIATSRARLLAREHPRSCLTCGEDACRERPAALALVGGARWTS